MRADLRANRNIVYSCKFHVVWCPKHRRKVLAQGVDVHWQEIIHEVVAQRQAEVIELEITGPAVLPYPLWSTVFVAVDRLARFLEPRRKCLTQGLDPCGRQRWLARGTLDTRLPTRYHEPHKHPIPSRDWGD